MSDAATVWIKRPPTGPLLFVRPLNMGVFNVTPDSFSDGGQFQAAEAAIAHGRRLIEEGADILDIGGESTRPGADPVGVEEELARVLPVIEGLAREGVPLSIDTRHAKVMAAALEAGAAIINDISALSHDPDSLRVAAESDAPVVLMHSQGVPKTMQNNPRYGDVVEEVSTYLEERIETCGQAGIEKARLIADPGIGFGKTVEHNLALLAHLERFHDLGCPLLLGVSRKSFIARLSADEPPDERLGGSLAAALAGLSRGVHILRVHDVAQTRQAVRVWQAVSAAAGATPHAKES
ncbi:MAG: dihydropteroate synthase [Alphaproteobacteria bacterium]|nr:dihydropteroate synthase [Alphaproteobacteria bacterium]